MSSWIVTYLWLIPAVPFAASPVLLSFSRARRNSAAALAVAGQIAALTMAIVAVVATLQPHSLRAVQNCSWVTLGGQTLRRRSVLDRLAFLLVLSTSLGQ